MPDFPPFFSKPVPTSNGVLGNRFPGANFPLAGPETAPICPIDHHEKGFGTLQWFGPGGWRDLTPFPFGLDNFAACCLPPEPVESQAFPTSLLADLEKCNRVCSKAWSYSLDNIRITPGGELGASDGKRLLGDLCADAH